MYKQHLNTTFNLKIRSDTSKNRTPSKLTSKMATATFVCDNHSEENTVVQKLNELFGNVLNLDVIKRVADSCHYDVIESSNKLLEITSFPVGKTVLKLEAKVSSKNTPTPIPRKITSQAYTVNTSIKDTCFTPMSRKAQDIERAINHIQKGYKILILMRGIPGSGKSYLSKDLLQSTVGFNDNYKLHILSTDDFFEQNGVYQFDPMKLPEAHGWNHNRAFQALSRGFSPIIIDNTNIQMWEMKPYAMMATDHGYIIEIIEPDTHWCFNEKELAKRNSHRISRAAIKGMIERYEKNITPKKLLSAYNLTYRLQKPPQMRLYPPLSINISGSTNSPRTNIRAPESSEGNNMKSKSVSVLNVQPFESKSEPVETINLMDFNDDKAMQMQPIIRMRDNEISVTTWNQNTVDDILMCDSTNENSNILLPSSQNDIITIDSSDDEISTPQAENKLFADIETAWGVNENALRSWDIVTPVTDDGNYAKVPQCSTSERKVITIDSGCNTDDECFQLLRNRQIIPNIGVKILETLNRDINRHTPEKKIIVSKKYAQDKSCMTDDIFENYDIHISQLINMFPSVPHSHLKYWYKKCNGDLEWTIEFLLEAKEEINTLTDECNDDGEADTTITNDTENYNSDSNQGEADSKGVKIKRIRNTSDEYKDLKKLIESKFDINEEHYSKHMLKIKHFKFGNGNGADNTQASTSNYVQLNATSNVSQPSSPESSVSKGETIMTDAGKVVMIDSDMEFEDFDCEDYTKPETKPEETIELNLGDNFVTQLENTFGDPNMTYPRGFQPVVQVPITLARQLYTFYIESVYQQMETQKQVLETLISEDEEFARKLQAKEQKQAKLQEQAQQTPSFRDIMNEQVAQGFYQKEVDKWKNLNPDNLSARLTRQKLFNVFPSIDRETLVEILYAHNNKYEDTVETLLASTRGEDVRGTPSMIKEPPLREEVLQEMRDAQKNNSKEEYVEQQKATFYREEANRYLNKRAELYQRAQQYHQRGMTEVAQFYSGLASQQTEYFDRANSMAAMAFLDEHSKRLQDFNTIDLHFLYVKEALSALDLFLDRNINLLRLSDSKRAEYLQVITGRGKRSENGVSKIRPAAIARLKKRNIQFVQLNPGLLKVKVTRNSLATSEIQSN